MTWDLQQRLQEIVDLQKDLNDTQFFLTEERKRFMRVVAENDELRGMNCKKLDAFVCPVILNGVSKKKIHIVINLLNSPRITGS